MRQAAGLPSLNAFDEVSTCSIVDPDIDPDLAFAIAESMRTLQLERVMREGDTTNATAAAAAPIMVPYLSF